MKVLCSSSSSQKSYVGHPGFHRFRAPGSLQYNVFLRAQPQKFCLLHKLKLQKLQFSIRKLHEAVKCSTTGSKRFGAVLVLFGRRVTRKRLNKLSSALFNKKRAQLSQNCQKLILGQPQNSTENAKTSEAAIQHERQDAVQCSTCTRLGCFGSFQVDTDQKTAQQASNKVFFWQYFPRRID